MKLYDRKEELGWDPPRDEATKTALITFPSSTRGVKVKVSF